jgi:lysophospholipase L1-like esterase
MARRFVGVALIAALLLVSGYATYRVARHLFFPQRGHAAACNDALLRQTIPAHPIVAFGDSITWGYLATRNCVPEDNQRALPLTDHVPGRHDTSYPAELSRLVRVPVLNFGLNGERTDTGLKRFRKMLSAVHPSSVVILEGVNDLLQGRKPQDVVARLRQMVDASHAAGATPILVTLLPTGDARINDEIASVDAGMRELARSRNTSLVDAHAAFASVRPVEALFQRRNGQTDGLHPNDGGVQAARGDYRQSPTGVGARSLSTLCPG